jgi:hypothetical protein
MWEKQVSNLLVARSIDDAWFAACYVPALGGIAWNTVSKIIS